MRRRDIILKRAFAVNEEVVQSLNENNTATELKELDSTLQNRQIKQNVNNTYEDTINIETVPAIQTALYTTNNTLATCKDKSLNKTDNNLSVESYISVDPPSYSPITPRNIFSIDKKNYSTLTTPDPDLHDEPDEIVQNVSENVLQSVEDSPVRPMSPATLGVLQTILDSSDDDSVKDPDYIIVPESPEILDTDSESILIHRSGKHDQNTGDYMPLLEEEISRGVNEQENNTVCNVSDVDEAIETSSKGRPKRGRKRKHEEYTLAERKRRKYANLPYKGKNKEIIAKTFKNYECVYKKQCHLNVNEEERKKEFNKFITLGSYEARLLYICSNVTENPKKRSYVSKNNISGTKKPRNFSRNYKISNIPVCRDMFLKTFQITTQKVTISLKKQRDGDKLRDCRGVSSGGWNKTSQQDIEFVCKIIDNLPKYESHYRRSQIGDAKYLKPGLTLQKIYDLYVNEFKKVNGDDKKCLSLSIVRKIFLNEFNLRFKSLKKDTCNKCDTFAAKLKSQNDLPIEERNHLLSEKDKHLKLAETLRSQMNSHIDRAKADETFECITFDMEKTLPLPRIPTNVVFYKRQLWFYNCGIHVSSTNQGYCFVWIEGEAGRGAQEVGSCLSKFVNQIMRRPKIEYLSLWSDSCGGQNRNIKMVLLLKVVLAAHPTLKMIDLNFLESGHTFLPNDTDFGKIECHLKNFQRLYTAEDYINVIKTCTKKTPLVPIKMEKEDFLSTRKLEKNMTNRKTFINKDKVNWLKTKHIKLKKDRVHSVFMKYEGVDEYQELYIGRKIKGNVLPLNSELLVPLWPDGKPITQAKLNDLKSMFHLIPEDCLSFYKQLKGMEGLGDDIEGFGGELDFDLEIEETQDQDHEQI